MSHRFLPCVQCGSLNRVPLERLREEPRCGRCKQGLDISPVLPINGEALHAAIAFSPQPVVVDFWAPWCGPCRSFAPVFQGYAARNPDKAIYLKLDTDAQKQAASRYRISSLPTLVVFSGGKEVARQSGALNPSQLQSWLAGFTGAGA